MADKNMSNFLATDKVPDTIFGIPIVSRREDYTEADIAFFKEHPEAGGYYDMGEDSAPNDSGGVAASKGGDSFIERARRRIGEAGEVADYSLAWIERQHKQVADMKVPVVSKLTEAVLQPAVLGARAAVANLTSGGGKYYQPEVRDERYFSNDALKDLGTTLKYMRGRTSGRSDGMDNAAQFNLTQTLGGFSVKNKAVTDTFDIHKSYQGVPQPLTDVARAVLGKQEDPDAGKVRTEIPLSKIPGANKVQTGGEEMEGDIR